MKTINKIMVAVDFSDYSLPSLTYAVELAKDVGANLLLTNVLNQRDIDMMNKVAKRVPEFPVEKHVEEAVQERSENLLKLLEKVDTGNLDEETNVRTGVPYKALLKEIEEKSPDLLVMGIKGRSNLVDTIIGSCAQKLYRRCPIPLLSLRMSALAGKE